MYLLLLVGNIGLHAEIGASGRFTATVNRSMVKARHPEMWKILPEHAAILLANKVQ
jgi:hypothetical protein